MPTNQKVTEESLARMVTAYENGETCRQIARREGLHFVTVGKKLRAAGVAVTPGPRSRWNAEEVVALANDGESAAAIARRLGVSSVTISRALRAAGMTSAARQGSEHHSWRGGRVAAAGGYVWLRPEPGEFPEMRNHQGYVPEHRLVMARSLGRALTRAETVHHKNGDRADNRLENLELRAAHGKHQAFRCRACGSTDVEAI